MKSKTFFCHQFDDKSQSFSVTKYSRFKHGSLTVAHEFGKELAVKFCREYDFSTITKQIVVYPSPFYFIPSACSYIKDAFLSELNRHLVKMGRQTAIENKILRRLSYHADYGKMSAEERASLIAQDKFYLDKEFAKEHFCIFLDDVKITGSHEIEIMKLINGHPIDYCCVYYAGYTGTNELVEDFLNTNLVNNIASLQWLIEAEPFFFNVRNIRVMLSQPNEVFFQFIKRRTESFNNELLNLCLGNEYHLVDKYKNNLHTLSRYVSYSNFEPVN
jgi:hypothetical protein